MINIFDIADAIVAHVNSFQTEVDDRTIKVERSYHFEDPKKIPKEELWVQVYPLARQKERQGHASKFIRPTLYVSMRAKVLPGETQRLDQLIQYGMDLDEHFEGVEMADAKYVMTDEDQFYWFPDELHQRHHFYSILELYYQWSSPIGGDDQ